MGKWLEVLRDRPLAGADGYSQRRLLIVAEIAPHPLLEAGRWLGSENREFFPMLDLVRKRSPAYIDEWLWLDERQAKELLSELRRVRRICRREEFLTGLDGHRFYELWRDGESPEEFEGYVDRIEQALSTEGGRWVLLSL